MSRIFFLFLFFYVLGNHSHAQESLIAFVHVTVIDATGAAQKENMTVLVKGSRISEIGKTDSIKIPGSAKVINGKGKYLIPGLWDMHVHLAKTGENSLALFIVNGITGVREMGGDPSLTLKWREEIKKGFRLGPTIKAAGPILESRDKMEELRAERTVEPFEKFRIGVGNIQQADSAVDAVKKMGADFIKIRTVQSLETYKAIAAAAKQSGLTMVGHPSAPIEEIINAEQKSIEHPIRPPLDNYTQNQREDFFLSMVRKNISIVPTLVTGTESIFIPKKNALQIVYDTTGKLDARRKYLSGYLIEDWIEQVNERSENLPAVAEKLRPNVLRDLREMYHSGVRIMAGTDAGVVLIYPGFTLHRELELLVKDIGLTPMEALLSATRYPAEFFGIQDSLGTIEKGKIADLVLLNENPLVDIRNTQKIYAVVKNGVLLHHIKLKSILKKVYQNAKKQNASGSIH